MSNGEDDSTMADLQYRFAEVQLPSTETADSQTQFQTVQPREFSPLEVIFSCGVCQDTLQSIYSEPDDNIGLRNSPDSNKGTVIKLWMTECAHLTCGKHLEGGGAPFHPDGQPPRVPCPVCSAEKGDTTQKALYAVHGFQTGEYDQIVPENFFQLPPVNLDADDPGMDAMRFQYLSLVRYSSKILHKLEKVVRDKDDLQRIVTVHSRATQKLEGQKGLLEVRIKELEREAEKYRTFKEREPQLLHYLSVISPMSKENMDMKEQLRSLGYAVPNTNYAMQVSDESAMGKMPRRRSDDDVAVEDDGMDDANDASGKVSLGQHPAPVSYSTHVRTRGHLAQEQVEQPGRSHVEDGQMEQGSSGRKRKYVDLLDPLGNNGRSSDGVQIGRPIESRDMMPPPPLPLPKRPRLESQLSNIQNQPFSTPNPRADLREVHADDSSSTIRQGQKLTDAHREQSHMPFIQERQDFGENLPSGELSMHGYPPKGRNTPFGLPAKQSDRNYGVGPTYPDHSSMTSSRSTDKGRLLAPRTSNDSATLQDGELDRQFLYTQQQNPPARLTPSPSRNRLTLPPPPPTINRKNSPSRQGLFANIRSSASSESLPHRQPLAFSFGYGKQSTTPSWQQSYPHTPRRTLGSAQEAFVYPAQMSRNTNTATQQLSLVNDRRSSNSRLSLSQQSTSPFFMIDGSRSGNNFHDVETSTDSRTFLQGFRVDAHPQINTSTNHYPSTSSPFIADPRISSIADQHRFQPVVHEPASNDTSSGSMARFMPAYNPGLLHDPNRRGMAASRQTTSGLYTPAPTTTGSAFRPNGSSGPSMLKGQGIPGVARQAEDMHLGGFLRRDEYENGPRGLFSASGRRSVRR